MAGTAAGGVTKGGAVQRIMEVIAQSKPQLKPDFVFCAGHFMHRDEDIFSYFHNEETAAREKDAKAGAGAGAADGSDGAGSSGGSSGGQDKDRQVLWL